MSDLIDRQAAIDALGERPMVWTDNDSYSLGQRNQYDSDRLAIETVPSAEPELYGYKIEHLALIARVMQKEGVTPEKAVQTFVDMKRIIEMLIEEIQKKVERAVMEVEHDES